MFECTLKNRKDIPFEETDFMQPLVFIIYISVLYNNIIFAN